MPTNHPNGLKAAMSEKGMTVRELAALLETDQAVISRYRGGYLPTKERRKLIAQALKVPQRRLWPDA